MATKVIFLTATGTGTYTLPTNFVSLVSVEAIGGGGSGAVAGGNTGFGGGGGGYSYSNAITGLTAGQTLYYNVGLGGTSGSSASDGGDTWFNTSNSAPVANTTGVLAKGGTQGTTSSTGIGGAAASGVGTIKFSGGNGGASTVSQIRAGGGGAAGPSGNGGNGGDGYTNNPGSGGGGGGANGGTAGANGTASVGGNGGDGGGGTGGGAGATSSVVAQAGTTGTGGGGGGGQGSTNWNGGNGGTGSVWTQTSDGSTAGPGGGGGGSALNSGGSSFGGNGVNYGGAGGAGGSSGAGAGGQGIIVLTYSTAGSRLTNTGALLVNGSFDEVTLTTGATVQRLLSDGTLQVSGSFDEVFMSSGSLQFNGSTQWLTFPGTGITLSATDFTIEAWVYFTAAGPNSYSVYPNGSSIFGQASTGFTISFGGNTSSFNSISIYANNGISSTVSGTIAATVNTWYHIAVVHTAAGNWAIYLNGVALTLGVNIANATWTDGATFYIARNGTTGREYYLTGYISNFRLVAGTQVYTSNFTPPTAPLPPITNTKLLLNTSQNTNSAFLDSGPNKLTVTRVGTPTAISTSPFGYGSLSFNGTTQYLTVPSSANLLFGTGNFTVEAWIYHVGSAPGGGATFDNVIFGAYNATAFVCFLQNSDLAPCLYDGTTQYTSATALTPSTWTHVAWVRSSSVLAIYVNGVSTSITPNTTLTTNFATARINYIGRDSAAADRYFSGYLTDIKVTKGLAIYTSNFTPPTSRLTTSTGTVLLMNTVSTDRLNDSSTSSFTITGVPTLTGPPYVSSSPLTVTGLAARQLSDGTLQVSGYFDEYTGF